MTSKQRKPVARAARLLLALYRAQGDDRATAARRSLDAFRSALDGTRPPRTCDLPGLGQAVDDVGVVMLALRSAGIDEPGPALAESIFEAARRALEEGGGS